MGKSNMCGTYVLPTYLSILCNIREYMKLILLNTNSSLFAFVTERSALSSYK